MSRIQKEKLRLIQESNRRLLNEQSRNTDAVKSTATDSESHEKFMTTLCGMDIVVMGDKMIGRRKCDGNKTDGSGGCYEPLIKLIKEYCKTK